MLLAASVLPSRGLLASGAREKGVVVRPLGGLLVSEPTGLRVGVDVVDAACLTPCATGRAVRVHCVRGYSVLWRERVGEGVDVRRLRWMCGASASICACSLPPRVSTLCCRGLRVVP